MTPTPKELSALAPSWKDAPDEPGLWLREHGARTLVSVDYSLGGRLCINGILLFTTLRDGSRYFGPIPTDTKDTK